jgi:hypothetical protein
MGASASLLRSGGDIVCSRARREAAPPRSLNRSKSTAPAAQQSQLATSLDPIPLGLIVSDFDETIKVPFPDKADLKCKTCGKAFKPFDTCIDFQDLTFHQEHFRCYSCQEDLTATTAVPFFYHDKLFCEPHYNEAVDAFNRLCAGCGQKIDADATDLVKSPLTNNLEFHKECLHCSICKESLVDRKFYVESPKKVHSWR